MSDSSRKVVGNPWLPALLDTDTLTNPCNQNGTHLAQWLSGKKMADGLGLILRSHMVERKNRLSQSVL